MLCRRIDEEDGEALAFMLKCVCACRGSIGQAGGCLGRREGRSVRRTESTAEASLLFQPDILGMTSACQPQLARRGSGRGRAGEHPFRRSLARCRSPPPLPLSRPIALPSLFGLNSDSGMIDAFDVFQAVQVSGCTRRQKEWQV